MSISSPVAIQQIDTLMNNYYENGLFDGVLLVAEKKHIIYHKAFGLADREWNIPMTTNTKFKIASISKPFTAIIILQLVQEGKIKLDGTLAEYIPDYTGAKKDSITIHQLLTHTSGLIGNLKPEDEAVQERLPHELRSMVHYAEDASLLCEPGSEFHYSNFGYNILAFIAEQVTGKPFAVLLQERVFTPGNMIDSKQYVNTQIEPRLARGYEYKLLTGYENTTFFDNSFVTGCGGVISTAEDMFNWHCALFSDRLVTNELKQLMYKPIKQVQYGYGWGINYKTINNIQDTLIITEHSGSINGFGSYFGQVLDDTTCIIVLKNSRENTFINPVFAPDIAREIISLLYNEKVPPHKKSIARHLALIIGKEGFDTAKKEYYRIKQQESTRYLLDESELNKLGIELLFKFKLPDEALHVFALNLAEFPKSYNTYDSYAYALMQKQEYAASIRYYREGLEILKKYPRENAGPQIEKDAQNALEFIKEMESKLSTEKRGDKL